MNLSLKDKVALITGSTKGIGLGIARVFASVGAIVVMHGSRTAEAAQPIVKQVQNDYPETKIVYLQADMSDMKAAKNLVTTVIEQEGKIDILINNAGVQHVSPIETFPEDEWHRLIQINLSSAFITMKTAVAYWKAEQEKTGKRPWGRIINISSVHGKVASIHKSAYIASKHGLNGLTKVVALELAADTDITVNAVCPGWVDTKLVRNQITAIAKQQQISEKQAEEELISKKQPTKRFSTCEQIGQYCLFLSSDAASNITGAEQVIDGAWSTQ